jgi:hypothetical protein
MTKRIGRVAFALVLSMVVGCGDDMKPESGDVLAPLNSPVIFQVKDFSVGESPILLRMLTEAEYECFNFTIDSEVAIDERTISVTLNGVREPAACLAAIGQANFAQELDLLLGTYELRIVRDARVDTYEVTVMDGEITIFGEPGEHSRPGADRDWDRWETFTRR